jgi:nucleotide-binding universal stress UspA family protein
MIELKHILCPVDLSPYSRRALGYAASIARWYKGRVTALHVTAEGLPPLSALAEAMGSLFESPAEPADVVGRFAAPVAQAAGVTLEVVIREGDAAEQILAYEKETRPDVIAVGTHGLSPLESRILGAVADKVIRGAQEPVLAVHEGSSTDVLPRSVPFGSVLVAVDFSHPSVRALEYAYGLAQESDARIVLLHVVEEGRSEESSEAAERTARRRLRDMLPQDALEWCEPEIVVVHGSVDDAIGRISDEWGTELIVLGADGQRATGFGAHVAGILRQAKSPVLLMPASTRARDLAPPDQLTTSGA